MEDESRVLMTFDCMYFFKIEKKVFSQSFPVRPSSSSSSSSSTHSAADTRTMILSGATYTASTTVLATSLFRIGLSSKQESKSLVKSRYARACVNAYARRFCCFDAFLYVPDGGERRLGVPPLQGHHRQRCCGSIGEGEWMNRVITQCKHIFHQRENTHRWRGRRPSGASSGAPWPPAPAWRRRRARLWR